MDICDFLGDRRRRVEFLATETIDDPSEHHHAALLYAGMHRLQAGEGGARFKDHFTLHVIVEGEAEARIGKKKQHLKVGDAFLYLPMTEKHLHAHTGGCTWAWLGFHSHSYREQLTSYGLHENQIIHHADSTIKDDFLRLYEDLTSKSTLIQQRQQHLLHLLLLQILSENGKPFAKGRSDLKDQHPSVIRARELIQRSSGEIFNAADIARAVGLERSYFSRLFKQQTGMTVHAALSQVRLRRAESLLRETDLPIYAIAELCGFEEYYSFHRFFKRACMKSPSDFRMQSKS